MLRRKPPQERRRAVIVHGAPPSRRKGPEQGCPTNQPLLSGRRRGTSRANQSHARAMPAHSRGAESISDEFLVLTPPADENRFAKFAPDSSHWGRPRNAISRHFDAAMHHRRTIVTACTSPTVAIDSQPRKHISRHFKRKNVPITERAKRRSTSWEVSVGQL